jgi:hypothetical protein
MMGARPMLLRSAFHSVFSMPAAALVMRINWSPANAEIAPFNAPYRPERFRNTRLTFVHRRFV